MSIRYGQGTKAPAPQRICKHRDNCDLRYNAGYVGSSTRSSLASRGITNS